MNTYSGFVVLAGLASIACGGVVVLLYLFPSQPIFAVFGLSLALILQFIAGFIIFRQIDVERQAVFHSAQSIFKFAKSKQPRKTGSAGVSPASDRERIVLTGKESEIAQDGTLVSSLPTAIVDGRVCSGATALSVGSLVPLMAELEIAFRESLLREKSVVENAADVICTIDTTGTILSANPAAKSVLGYAPEALIGKQITTFLDGDGQQSLVEFLGAKESINKIIVENRFRKKDGTIVDLLWSAHWSASDEGLFCIAHDISQRKAAEAAKEQLLQMREESAAMRQRLMDIIVHDIRSPLASLLTTQALLLNGAFGELNGPRMRSKIEICEQEVQRIIGLINDLLTLSRYDSSKVNLQKVSLSITQLICEVVDSFKEPALQKSVTISTELVEANADVDNGMIVQVMETLISNAIGFSSPNQQIKVRASKDASSIRVEVSDTGAGIPKDMETAIFLPYKNLDSTKPSENTKIGTGLSICREIIESHGGTIGVNANPLGGSCFYFTLPIARA